DLEERRDECERLLGPLRIRGERLVEVAAAVLPAAYLDDAAVQIEVIVDSVRVGDEVTLVAAEDFVDSFAVVSLGELEQHVQLGRDQDPEVAVAALLWSHDEHARRIDTQVRRPQRILP